MIKPSKNLDLLLVVPPNREIIYQVLANELAASEPPIWGLLIANYIRKFSYSVQILDADALGLDYNQTVVEIEKLSPKLVVFLVYGQQPSASTSCMPSSGIVCRLLKCSSPEILSLLLGTHPSALPEKTLKEEATDFVCKGEGPKTILNLLNEINSQNPNYSNVKGLWYKDNGAVRFNPDEEKISDLDNELNDMAWDLLPMDKYKAHNWHCWSHINDRKPYASIYTSLGCPYKCSFCCINAPFGGPGIRYFSPEWTIKQIDILVTKYGVKNLKIADEMFVLNPKHVLGLAQLIIDRGYNLNIWAYARVDTVKEEFLAVLKKAGFNWLALGIESGNKLVRNGVEKGRFDDIKVPKVIKQIRDAGINVCANYIFGLPNDTHETMQETLDLALSLNTEYANFYSAMAYPGSALHIFARDKKLLLPEDPKGPGWIGYSQYSFDSLPLPTDSLSSSEILSFRDFAFDTYFKNPNYLAMINKKFGKDAVTHIEDMTSYRIKRKHLQ